MTEIRLTQTPHELTQIARLRYAVYVEGLGATMAHADHELCEVRDAWDATAFNLGAWREGELIGGVRLNFSPETELTDYADYASLKRLLQPVLRGRAEMPLRFSVASKLAVRPSHRGGLLASRLMQACYEQTRLNRAQLCLIHSQITLLKFYQKFGFQVCGTPRFHAEAGELIPMALVTEDREYLAQIRSPFLSIGERFAVNQPQATALRQAIQALSPVSLAQV